MQDWETMIADRVAAHGVVVTCREQDPRRRNRQAYDRRHDKTPKRIAQHKAWEKSELGRLSQQRRGARYRATEKGILNSRKKARKYYLTHCMEPEFIERHKVWDRAYKLRTIPGKLRSIPYTITLMGMGAMTVNIVTTRRVA